MKTYTQNMTVRLVVRAETAEEADRVRRVAMDGIELMDMMTALPARMKVIAFDPFRDCHARPEPEDITA